MLPKDAKAVIDLASWQRPAIFDWIQTQGNVETREMFRTLNCGVGMVVCISADRVERALALLRAEGEAAFVIGHIEPLGAGEEPVELKGLNI